MATLKLNDFNQFSERLVSCVCITHSFDSADKQVL